MTSPHPEPATIATRPSLETMAGLYGAALDQREQADRFHAHVVTLILRHGYTEAEVLQACAQSLPK